MKDIVVAGVDIETTGLLTSDHRIIEIYIGLWRNGKRILEFDQRVDPKRSIAVDAQRVHGISATDLIGKPEWDEVAPAVAKIFRKCHLVVAHNGEEFDWPFIAQEMKRVGVPLPSVPLFDTMLEGVWATPDGKKPRLEELCFACDVSYDKTLAHAASYDVERMMECFFSGIEWGFFDPTTMLSVTEAA